MPTTTTTNRYLEGNYGPVREELTVADLPVSGSIPDFLDGRFLRNGPNPIGDPNPATYHWFLGTGMVHGIRIRGGKVEWYRNRWVRSGDVADALGEPRRPARPHAGFDFPANTHVIAHAGKTLAIVESGPRPYELTDELDTVGSCDFDGTLPGGYTAHPLRDPGTGELHAVSYYWGWGNKVQYSVVGTDGRVKRLVDVEVTGNPMMHAFSLTEQYVVIYDLPVTLDVSGALETLPSALAKPIAGMARRLSRRPVPDVIAAQANSRLSKLSFPYSWDPEYPARVGLLPRAGDAADVRWFDVEPCYVYHPLNAYDDGDQVVLDVVRHPKTFAANKLEPNDGPPTLDRWTVDTAAGKVLEERVDDRPQEFPRIDERLTAQRHRYGYSVGVGGPTLEFNVVSKHDVASGKTQTRDFGAKSEIDEFVFVPSSDDAAEDAGVLIGFVYDGDRDKSDLHILDAETLETVGAVHLPARVPHGFHGSWVPATP